MDRKGSLVIIYPPVKADSLEWAAKESVQVDFEYLQRRKLHHHDWFQCSVTPPKN